MHRRLNPFRHTLLAFLPCLVFLAVASSAQAQIPDLTNKLDFLGNPVTQFYTKTSDKSPAQDLQIFGDRLYIGHGSTSSSQNTRVLYYDLKKKAFDYERDASGNAIWMQSELMRSMRVQNGELLIEDYDPHGKVRFYRKDAQGNWTIRDVASDAHARDLFSFNGEYFINYGNSSATFPYMYRSADGGKSWSAVKQPELHSTFGTAYEEFFEFGGEMYATGVSRGYDASTKSVRATGQPFMLRYAGKGKFDVAYDDRNDFMSGSNSGTEYVRLANKLGSKLLFAWGDKSAYLATSIEPAQFTQVNLPKYSIRDITVYNGYAYVLMWTSSGSTFTNYVYRVAPDGSVEGVLSAKLNDIFMGLELHQDAVYLSTTGLKLYKADVKLAGSSTPPPVTEPTPPAPTPTPPAPTPTPPPPAPSYPGYLELDLKVFLQGPYEAGQKRMHATIKNFLDVETAFAELPAKKYGDAKYWAVQPSAFAAELVDFLVIELRTSTSPSSLVMRRVALLMGDGKVRGFDGSALPRFSGVPVGKYYVVVRHRNHLDVMSAAPVTFAADGTATYDFTKSASAAYGTGGQVQIESGVYGLYTGDMDASGSVDATDIFNVWSFQNGYAGYRTADLDLSGFVNAFDFIKLWLPNSGRRTNVPD